MQTGTYRYLGFLILMFFIKGKSMKIIEISKRVNNINDRSAIFATTLKAPTESEAIERKTIVEQIGAASVASAAVLAATAVNAAVGMRTLEAPDTTRTYVSRDISSNNRTGKIDEYGLPLVYDKNLIQDYWKSQGSALTQRWTEFLGYAVPYLTRVITLVVTGGNNELKKNSASLAKDARVIFEKLGPTYIKMGQMMSVRPDVLPPEALNELKILQDSVKPFDSITAIASIESELGGSLGEFFSEISEVPVAAASLAQVYKAKLLSTGEYVAVKVQRPRVLETVSKDLYVLRRAAEVYQGLIERFAPQQRTNYVALLNEWAVGFYTELDFLNEAANQSRLKDLLQVEGIKGVYVPKVYHELCTRRILVSEWIDGQKLSDCRNDIIASLIPDAQEAFLTQLLQIGFFHADPHPGNMLVMNEPRDEAKIALIDFGLVASVQQSDMDTMISAIIHLANRDYASLVDDFIALEILPNDCDRSLVVPLMDKALTPYVKGGGAQKYEAELRKTYGLDGSFTGTTGGFQAMTQDALTVLNDIPFSIPPYFALLGRAIVTLEGIALTGDPNYGIILEAYPFVARKLLQEDRPAIQQALQQVLYGKGGKEVQSTRLSVLLNSALGVVARTSGAVVDFDAIPEDGVDVGTAFKFLLGEKSASLRKLLLEEAVTASDILLRQASRKAYGFFSTRLPRPPFIGRFLPRFDSLKLPVLIPNVVGDSSSSTISVSPSSPKLVYLTPTELLDITAPKLSREEELYAISLSDLVGQSIGQDAAVVLNGDLLLDPVAAARFIQLVLSSSSNSIIPITSNSFLSEIIKLIKSSPLLRIPDSNKDKQKNADQMVKDFTLALANLSDAEKVIFQNGATSSFEKLRDKLFRRLQRLPENVSFLT